MHPFIFGRAPLVRLWLIAVARDADGAVLLARHLEEVCDEWEFLKFVGGEAVGLRLGGEFRRVFELKEFLFWRKARRVESEHAHDAVCAGGDQIFVCRVGGDLPYCARVQEHLADLGIAPNLDSLVLAGRSVRAERECLARVDEF